VHSQAIPWQTSTIETESFAHKSVVPSDRQNEMPCTFCVSGLIEHRKLSNTCPQSWPLYTIVKSRISGPSNEIYHHNSWLATDQIRYQIAET
jgi:hypothetical protein